MDQNSPRPANQPLEIYLCYFFLLCCLYKHKKKKLRKMYGKDPFFEDKILVKAANLRLPEGALQQRE